MSDQIEKIEKKIEKLFIYYRVSTKLQNLKMQKRSISLFLSAKGDQYEVIDTFADDGISGATDNRPAYQRMKKRLTEIDGILVYNWDRMSRDEELANNLMYELREKNIFILESDTGQRLDFNQAFNRLITFIKSMEAERERLRHKQRTKDGIEAFRKKKGYWGASKHKSYGKTTDGKKISESRFWFLYELYRKAKVKKSAIARILGISRPTLYKRLKENEEKYNKIEMMLNNEFKKEEEK